MIRAAAEAGADYIKFQSWQAATNTRGQQENMRPYELSDDDHHRLQAAAQKAGIGFTTTVFDVDRVPFVASLGLDFVKVASSDCGSRRLLEELVQAGVKKMIVSTGMSEETEVRCTSALLRQSGVSTPLLHCMYPLVDGAFHLARMGHLRQYAHEVGLSDHSAGHDLRASKLAIGLGADWIERHFILDRTCTRAKDTAVSVDPAGLRELVEATQQPDVHLSLAEEFPELLGNAQPVLSRKVCELREFYVGRWGENCGGHRAA
jgi:sialic acid synthase SpsE